MGHRRRGVGLLQQRSARLRATRRSRVRTALSLARHDDDAGPARRVHHASDRRRALGDLRRRYESARRPGAIAATSRTAATAAPTGVTVRARSTARPPERPRLDVTTRHEALDDGPWN